MRVQLCTCVLTWLSTYISIVCCSAPSAANPYLNIDQSSSISVKPVIYSVVQLSETSVEIKWRVATTVAAAAAAASQLRRFRIQVSEDEFVNDIREWPGITYTYYYYLTHS